MLHTLIKQIYLKKITNAIKGRINFIIFIIKQAQFSPKAIFQTICYSGIRNILKYKGIICTPHCTINISKSAEIKLNGILLLGEKTRFPSSKLETRLLVASGGKLSILNDISIGYGGNIEVHENANLIFHGKKFLSRSGSNIGMTIICADNIEIGPDFIAGRNIHIRDTNGGHYINLPDYKNTKPVKIGEKVWLCESCVIMPDAHIGDGAVVGAKAFVTSTVPSRTLVAGIPAQVIHQNIEWKY